MENSHLQSQCGMLWIQECRPVQPEGKAATVTQVPGLEEADLLQRLLPGSLKPSMPSSAFQAVR